MAQWQLGWQAAQHSALHDIDDALVFLGQKPTPNEIKGGPNPSRPGDHPWTVSHRVTRKRQNAQPHPRRQLQQRLRLPGRAKSHDSSQTHAIDDNGIAGVTTAPVAACTSICHDRAISTSTRLTRYTAWKRAEVVRQIAPATAGAFPRIADGVVRDKGRGG